MINKYLIFVFVKYFILEENCISYRMMLLIIRRKAQYTSICAKSYKKISINLIKTTNEKISCIYSSVRVSSIFL